MNCSNAKYAAEDFQYYIEVDNAVRDPFDAIADVSAWWAKDFTGTARAAGDAFTVRFGETFAEFRIDHVAAGRHVVWEVVDSRLPWLSDEKEWNGTRIAWNVSRQNNTTRVSMRHIGLTPQILCYEKCRAGWSHFVGTSLRGLLAEGVGMPE
jgi:hypothetical protein